MKNIEWLDKFVSQQTEQTNKMKKTASQKKKVVADLSKYDMIVIPKEKLQNVKNGSKVKYNQMLWKVVNASYKDARGTGVVLSKIAGISTKPLTSPEERAYTDPGNVYDYNVRETSEVPDFESAANATAEQIARENAVDHSTTPAARLQNPVLMDNPVPAPVVEPSVPSEPVAEDPNAIPEGEPVVEPTVEDEPVEVEDDFSFDGVDDEPVEVEEESVENVTPGEDKKDEVKASVHKNRIIAAMLSAKK